VSLGATSLYDSLALDQVRQVREQVLSGTQLREQHLAQEAGLQQEAWSEQLSHLRQAHARQVQIMEDKVSRTPLGTPVRDTATPGSSPEIESTESWGLNGLSKHPPGAEEQGAGQPEPREQEADERALTEDEIEAKRVAEKRAQAKEMSAQMRESMEEVHAMAAKAKLTAARVEDAVDPSSQLGEVLWSPPKAHCVPLAAELQQAVNEAQGRKAQESPPKLESFSDSVNRQKLEKFGEGRDSTNSKVKEAQSRIFGNFAGGKKFSSTAPLGSRWESKNYSVKSVDIDQS